MDTKNVRAFLLRSEIIVVYVMVVLIIITTINNPTFLSIDNIMGIIKQFSFYGIMVVPLTFLMISLAFDMSIGMNCAVAASVSALLLRDHHWPFWGVCLIAVLIGATIGTVNGFIHAYLKVNAFIATLSMMYILKGLFWILSGQMNIVCNVQVAHIPSSFLGIPANTCIMIVVALIGMFILKYTRFGRSVYIIGNSTEVAREVGISEKRVKTILFAATGFCAGLCAIATIIIFQSVPTTTGTKYEFYVNAGAILGGASIYGGRGTVWGSLIGAAVMSIVQSSMRSLGMSTYWQTILLGAILILAIFIDTMKGKRKI